MEQANLVRPLSPPFPRFGRKGAAVVSFRREGYPRKTNAGLLASPFRLHGPIRIGAILLLDELFHVANALLRERVIAEELRRLGLSLSGLL